VVKDRKSANLILPSHILDLNAGVN